MFFDIRLLCTPIHCKGAIRLMNKRNDKLMMKKFWRWRELAFPPLVFAATGGMEPSATTVFRSLPLCWLRNGISSEFAVRC